MLGYPHDAVERGKYGAAMRKRGAEGEVHDEGLLSGAKSELFQGFDGRVLVVFIDGDAHLFQACFGLGAFLGHAVEFGG